MIREFLSQLRIRTAAVQKGPQPQRDRIQPRFDPHLSHLLEAHHARNRRRDAFPVGGFVLQMPPSETSKRIKLRAPVVLTRFPFRLYPALLLELVQSWVERPVADLQGFVRDLLESLAERPAVKGLKGKYFENQ